MTNTDISMVQDVPPFDRSVRGIRRGRKAAALPQVMKLQQMIGEECPACHQSGLCEHKFAFRPVIIPFR